MEGKADKLYEELYLLIRQMIRFEHRVVPRRLGLHRGQAHLLQIVAQNDGAFQRELIEQMDIRPSSLAEMLAKLETAGWVTRQHGDQDQRMVHVFLTPEGRAIVSQLNGSSAELSGLLFGCLTEEEKRQMLAITIKLRASLEAMDFPDAEEDRYGRDRPGYRHGGREHGHRREPPAASES